jgi:uncharacterized protein YbaR (Trm112 family)
MHIALTDVLTCPRCGPDFGLILMADRVEQRRALEGVLACANCRERYPLRAGYAELRLDGPAAAPAPATAAPEEVFRLAAALDLAEAAGLVLVLGRDGQLASALAGLAAHVEVVVTTPAASAWQETPGVSRLSAGAQLPFFHRTFRGVARTAGAETTLAEAARVVAPLGRLLLEEAQPADAEALEALGFEILLRAGDTLVARRKYV